MAGYPLTAILAGDILELTLIQEVLFDITGWDQGSASVLLVGARNWWLVATTLQVLL